MNEEKKVTTNQPDDYDQGAADEYDQAAALVAETTARLRAGGNLNIADVMQRFNGSGAVLVAAALVAAATGAPHSGNDEHGLALTAVALLETAMIDGSEQFLPENITEAHTLISALAWCGVSLAGQLAKQLQADQSVVYESLRYSINDAFGPQSHKEN